jgi:hypothetical protein
MASESGSSGESAGPGQNPRLNEDVRFNLKPGGPPLYEPVTDKPVQYLTVVDAEGTVIGYAWGNDEDDAAGFAVRQAGGPAAFNKAARWSRKLRECKATGLRPSQALAEMMRFSGDDVSRVLPDSLAEAPNADAVKALAKRE